MRNHSIRHSQAGPPPPARKAALYSIALLLILAMLACNMQQPLPTPLPPTPVPALCREVTNVAPVARPAAPTAYEATIARFLSDGGSPDALLNMLRDWGVITDQHGTVNAQNDFNGDGYLDVVVTLQYPSTTTELQPPGQLLVFGCGNSSDGLLYRALYGQSTAPGSATSMPQIIRLGDMTHDGQPELSFFLERCTTLVCLREPYILTWDTSRSAFRSLSESFAQFYHYTDAQGEVVPGFPSAGFEVADLTGDGPQEFTVREGHISLREAGPHRPATYTFAWHGTQYADPVVTYSPSGYLIHALRDADLRLRAGDLPEAIRLYTAVLHDGEPVSAGSDDRYPELITWGGIYPKPETHAAEEAMLDAYAQYRLILTHAANRDGNAQTLLQQMQRDLPWQLENVPSYYTRLAEIFMNTFLSAGGTDPLGTACTQVREFAARDMRQTFEYLGNPDYFGPALSDYTVDDLCPF